MWSGDNDAIWLMQALLHSVPLGRLVVLDLFAEVKPVWLSSEQFYGVPYIWKVGVGMCMEGVEQNPVVYDLMSEMAFHHEKVDVKTAPLTIWNTDEILSFNSFLSTVGEQDKNRDTIVAFPDADPLLISASAISMKIHHHYSAEVVTRSLLEKTADTFDHPHLWYSTSDVLHALKLFLTSASELSESNTFRYDLIDLTRQALAKYANKVFLKVVEAYKVNNIHGVTFYSQHFLDLVEDMDTLLTCHEGFLLGPWLESAKKLAQNPEQEKQMEWNARTQITMWFDNTEVEASLLRDYANKYWSGLLHDYYIPRAAIYFRFMLESVKKGQAFPLEMWRREWIKLTNEWQNSRKLFPVTATGDALNISQWLYDKYLSNADAYSF
ncbi:hypothetical protein ACLOJK_003890 [Asimina triloba]